MNEPTVAAGNIPPVDEGDLPIVPPSLPTIDAAPPGGVVVVDDTPPNINTLNDIDDSGNILSSGDADDTMQLLIQHDAQDDLFLQQQIEKETQEHMDLADQEEGTLIDSFNVPNEQRLKQLKMVHITSPDGKTLHKRTWLKMICAGTSLSKSMDRKKRVMNAGRHSDRAQDGAAKDNVITRAFNAGQFKMSYDRDDSNSASDLIIGGVDYCGVIVKTTNSIQMVICQFQRFGESTGGPQLEKSHPRGGGSYRATVQVQSAVECKNAADETCLKITGDIVGTLYDVPSACLEPFTPSLEEWDHVNEGLVTTAVMRVSDLQVSFNDMLARKKRHEPKEKHRLSIVPLVVGGEDHFVVDRVSDAYDVIVCNICIPPMAISGPGICGATYDEVKLNRVITLP